MFTGIVEEAGRVRSFAQGEKAWRLVIEASAALQDLSMGDSIAVNGCCLTAVAFDSESISFDLLEETVRLTAFRDLMQGDPVNLERSLRFNGKIGGHFVTGHIDAVGTLTEVRNEGKDVYMRCKVPSEFSHYLVYKGSIAMDGISLTVAESEGDEFAVWLIPHTLEVTNLKIKQPGSLVHLEFDLLGKYVEKLLQK